LIKASKSEQSDPVFPTQSIVNEVAETTVIDKALGAAPDKTSVAKQYCPVVENEFAANVTEH
jgi:hypothetical protein